MFNIIKKAVQDSVYEIQGKELYRTTASGDDLWSIYLNNLPEDRKQEHNCNCCKQFIRQFGGVVSIDDKLKTRSIWNLLGNLGIYEESVKALRDYVESKPIETVYKTEKYTVGTDNNWDLVRQVQWEHFYVTLNEEYVREKDTIATIQGNEATLAKVAETTLQVFSQPTIEVVKGLIDQGILYRGDSYRGNIEKLLDCKIKYDLIEGDVQRTNFCWAFGYKIATVKNSAIGTLLSDIESGMATPDALTRYENVVAPMNYKRPQPKVTQQDKDALAKMLEKLGEGGNLQRRHATVEELEINNLLYIDRSIAKKEYDTLSVLDGLIERKPTTALGSNISFNDFITNVIPVADNLQLLLDTKLSNRAVNLLTGKGKLFKWDSPLSWSYAGNVTSSIKDKVVKAGGNVTGELRSSLAWFTVTDLDLHCTLPSGREIYFGNKIDNRSTGKLDVDMNVQAESVTPVENIIFSSKDDMDDGDYIFKVDNYTDRGNGIGDKAGYILEIECRGEVYTRKVPHYDQGEVTVTYSKEKGIERVDGADKGGVKDSTILDLPTGVFHKITSISKSPNYFKGEDVGSEHLFFTLAGATTKEPVRAIYPEFVRHELVPYKRTIEALGSLLTIPYKEEEQQLAGIGFMRTEGGTVTVKATVDNVVKLFNVTIG